MKRSRHATSRGKRNLLFRHPVDNCRWCGKPLLFNESTLDHVLARSEGGSDRLDNFVIACNACNQKRGAETNKRVGNGEGSKRVDVLVIRELTGKDRKVAVGCLPVVD